MQRLWDRRPASAEELRKLVVDLAILIAIAVTAFAGWQAVSDDLTVVDVISIPKPLEERGYSGAIVAQRLIDDYQHISSIAKTRIGRAEIGRESRFSELGTLEVPSADISLKAIIAVLRHLIRGPDDKISGEILISRPASGLSPAEYEFRLRLDIDRDTRHRPGRPQDIRQSIHVTRSEDPEVLIRVAAERLVEQTNPTVFASYLYAIRKWQELDTLVERLMVSTKPEIGPRAQVIYGMRLLDRQKFAEAEKVLDRARKTRASVFADSKYAEALTASGNTTAALEQYESASRRDYARPWKSRPKLSDSINPVLFAGWATALEKQGKIEEAFKKVQEGHRRASHDPRILVKWGDLLRDYPSAKQRAPTEHLELAMQKYAQAIRFEPRSWVAHSAWGTALFIARRTDEAAERFELAIRADPLAAEPHYHLGRVHLDRNREADALAAFRKSTELDSEFAPGFVGWAEVLNRRGDFAGANDKFDKASKVDFKGYNFGYEQRIGRRDDILPPGEHSPDGGNESALRPSSAEPEVERASRGQHSTGGD